MSTDHESVIQMKVAYPDYILPHLPISHCRHSSLSLNA